MFIYTAHTSTIKGIIPLVYIFWGTSKSRSNAQHPYPVSERLPHHRINGSLGDPVHFYYGRRHDVGAAVSEGVVDRPIR
jgi:hypothetical protein